MNRALLTILALSCLTLGACTKNNATSEAPAVQPAPITIAPAESTEPPAVSPGLPEDDPFGEIPQPAPAPPVAAEATDDSQPPPQESASAAEVMDSVGRVLRQTIGADEDKANSKGSIFRSIGRALTKGAQEAASASGDDADASDKAE